MQYLKKVNTDAECVVIDGQKTVYSSNESKNVIIKKVPVETVDLGIVNAEGKKVLWANCNIGASAPEEYGKYFQWGDTVGYEGDEAKAHSTWSTAPFNDGNSSYSSTAWAKYASTVVDSNNNLVAAYDAATVAYGEGYRLPTKDEMQLLINNTEHTWTTLNGVNGYKFTSKIEGYTDKSIFVPAAGFVSNGSFNCRGSYGYVWSSSLYASSPGSAWYLYFSSGYMYMYSNYRYYGQSLRGVLVQD